MSKPTTLTITVQVSASFRVLDADPNIICYGCKEPIYSEVHQMTANAWIDDKLYRTEDLNICLCKSCADVVKLNT